MSRLPENHLLFVCIGCRQIYQGPCVPPDWTCAECKCSEFHSMIVNPMPSFNELTEFHKALAEAPKADLSLNDLYFLKEMYIKWGE